MLAGLAGVSELFGRLKMLAFQSKSKNYSNDKKSFNI
jgi:hypothetical protein